MNQQNNRFLHHVPCENCGSRDNLGVFVDDNDELHHTYCFGCQQYKKLNGELPQYSKPKEITNLIKSQLNAEVSPSQILLKEELNKIGLFKASINFHSEVQATISIKIDKIQSK